MPLKRHPALISLSHDHRDMLMMAQLMKRDAPAYPGMPVSVTDKLQYVHARSVMALFPHLQKEEEILFPAVAKRTKEMDAMIEELINEHVEIQHQINALPAVADPVEAMDKAGRLLERHIRKEERELFEMIQKELSPDELEALGKKFSD